MEQYNNAILWPVSKKTPVLEESNIDLHSILARDNGAVYWDVALKRKDLIGPFCGYLYSTKPIGMVTHKCVVKQVINRERLLEIREDHFLVPPFRTQCLYGVFEDGKPHEPSQTWIKICDIERLIEPISLDRFTRLDGSMVRSTRSGLIYVNNI
jgi:hypothetical protein